MEKHPMSESFPSAAPEMPVRDVTSAALYYEKCLGFHWDWGTEGIGQVSKGDCRLFLTETGFRTGGVATPPVVVWINLGSKTEVDETHEAWKQGGARIVEAPESKPWNLHEFIAADLDGNLFRVFYDFAWELPDRGGRVDDTEKQEAARTKA
jgi:uncharacterized glyoxalase superfamily protein PhnB